MLEITTLIGMMIGLMMVVAVRTLTDKEALCLPVGKDELADDETILDALNEVSRTVKFGPKVIRCRPHRRRLMYFRDYIGKWYGGRTLPWNLEWVKVFQNNPHHMEGWLYNHIILMLCALQKWKDDLTDDEYSILEQAIIWSDFGKFHTTKDGKKTWPDGTPISTAFGHAEKSAELYLEAGGVVITKTGKRFGNEAVYWLIAEHMKAHSLDEMDEKGKTAIPDFLAPQIEGLDAWNWPKWDDLDIPHGESLGKKDYAWKQRGSCKLLRIKQICDSEGRISDLDF